jgi:predicted enzyme related to lactoylglutathione lyase
MIRPRETVIMADDHAKLVAWYRDVLGFNVTRDEGGEYHYTNLENDAGIRIGIADAKEMGVTPGDRSQNPVVMQVEVDDVKAFFDVITAGGGQTPFGPSFEKKYEFWFGGVTDIEGNPIWVVDSKCP